MSPEHEDRGEAGRVALACTYCHDRLRRREGVFCAACLAPHHEDCRRRHGRCAAPGCREAWVLDPGELAAPAGVPRPLVALALAVWLTTVSAFAWSIASVRPRAQPRVTAEGLALAEQAEALAEEAEQVAEARGPRAALGQLARIADLDRMVGEASPGDDLAWRWIRNAHQRAALAANDSTEPGWRPCKAVPWDEPERPICRWGSPCYCYVPRRLGTARPEARSSAPGIGTSSGVDEAIETSFPVHPSTRSAWSPCGQAAVDAARDGW